MKKFFVFMICLLSMIACGNGHDVMMQKMEEAAERNKAYHEAEEAKKKEKPKFVDDEIKGVSMSLTA